MATIVELLNQAIRLHQGGQLRAAEPLYRQILLADPANAPVHHLLGLLTHQTGHPEPAVALIRRAIALNPAQAVFHFNLGTILKQQGKSEEAVGFYRQALTLQPRNPDALNNLGVALRDLGHATEAILCYNEALAINPRHAEAQSNLGNVLKDQGRLGEAISCFRRALAINPHFANAHYNLGNALKEEGQLADAVESFRHALQENPHLANAHVNLGATLMYFGQVAAAGDHYEQALMIESQHGKALWNRSLLGLLKGDFERGWRDYEARWTQPEFVKRHDYRPRWDGCPFPGKTILLHAEQGLGDTIQFVRLAPLVKKRGGTVYLECQASLVPLLTGMEGIDATFATDTPLPPFDLQVPLLSLPGIMGMNAATIPAPVPYVRVHADLVKIWKNELISLSPLAPRPSPLLKVGIAWQGNPKHKGDRYRSVPLLAFEPLARLKNCRLFSLQKGAGTEQLQAIGERIEITDIGGRTSDNFEEMAAVVKNMDLVISVDSALAHLAGALGVPVWVAVPSLPDWRWLLDRNDSPWYPTMRLFRQKRLGDWQEVFERIVAELEFNGQP